MTEDYRLSTIRTRIDQEIFIEAARGVEEIEDASVATEITAFDRETESYYLEGAILFSGFIREKASGSSEHWLRNGADIFDADRTQSAQGEVRPLYYRMPFGLRVPISSQEGPFFNVTARIGSWDISVSGPDCARVKADLLIQGLNGTGGYEFQVGSQREVRDSEGELVTEQRTESVDSPFVTYENQEWLLEGQETQEEEVIFTRELVAQPRSSDAQPEPEEVLSREVPAPEALEEAMKAAQEAEAFGQSLSENTPLESEELNGQGEADSENAGNGLTNGTLFPPANDIQYPYVTSVNLDPIQSQIPISPIQPPQAAPFPWERAESMQSPLTWQLDTPWQQIQQPKQGTEANPPLAEAPEAEADPVLAREENPAVQPAEEASEDVYLREAEEFVPEETYQFAHPDSSAEVSLRDKGEYQVEPNDESHPSYSVHLGSKAEESPVLSFAGLAMGKIMAKDHSQQQYDSAPEFDLQETRESSALAARESSSLVTTDSVQMQESSSLVPSVSDQAFETQPQAAGEGIWSFITDTEEKKYQLIFRIAQAEESLEEISAMYSVPIADLLRENRLAAEDFSAGQLLYIPTRNAKKKV